MILRIDSPALDRPIGDIIYIPEAGIIDSHGHGRDSDHAYKMTYDQYLLEAMTSHVGSTVFQPNPIPSMTTEEVLVRNINLVEKAREKYGISRKQYFMFGATDDNFHIVERVLKKYPEYVLGIKIYFLHDDGSSITTGKVGIKSYNSFRKHCHIAWKNDSVIAVHPDDPQKIRELKGYTAFSESACAMKCIAIGEEFPDLKMSMYHVSCFNSGDHITAAQRRAKIRLMFQICSHYVIFNADGLNWNPKLDPAYFWCYTPLRNELNRLYLNAILTSPSNLIELASDSACHTTEEKLIINSEGYPPGGFPGHQHLLPVAITKCKELNRSNRHLLNLVYYNPGRHLGIPTDDRLVPYRIELREDNAAYNNGKVTNPYQGMKLWYPVERIK